MLRAPAGDIVNSKNWTDGEWKSFFTSRLSDMRAKKKPFEALFRQYEEQETAISYYNNQGELELNVPMEQNLKEVYMGRTNGKIVYDVSPDGQANIEELQPSKYALNFFLDGNDKENFWKENKLMRENKCDYGTGVFFTGLRSYKDYRYVKKPDVEIQSGTDILNEDNFDQVEHETYFFFPKTIHPMDFYPDDKCYGQNDIQKADDCIFKEKISWVDYEMRYGDIKAFKNEDQVTSGSDDAPKNVNDQSIENNEIILHHYFHRVYKTWLTFSNETDMVFKGKYLYDDGKLPFDMIQHFTDSNCIWGRGYPAKIGYLKAYKSEILMDILIGAQMGSGVHLLTGNDDDIGQDWEVGGRGVNIWRTTGGAEKTQAINTQPNLTYFTNVIQILDDLLIQDTGDNLRAPVDAMSDRLGIVEIMEANKAVRQASVDENYNIGLDNVLTMTLSRIKQFAPALLTETIKDSEGKVIKTIFPRITIKDYRVTKEEGKTVIIEDIGKFGYFELKPETIQGLGVKVTTSSTNSILPILERQRFTELITNLVSLSQLVPVMPEIGTKMQESINVDDLIGAMNDAYGYDSKLKATSDKDRIMEANKKMIEDMAKKFAITTNPIPNETITESPTSALPSGQPAGAESAATAGIGAM